MSDVPEMDITITQAMVELVQLRNMILESAVPSIKRRKWRPSEKAMALAAQYRRATAIRMAIDTLKKEDDRCSG